MDLQSSPPPSKRHRVEIVRASSEDFLEHKFKEKSFENISEELKWLRSENKRLLSKLNVISSILRE